MLTSLDEPSSVSFPPSAGGTPDVQPCSSGYSGRAQEHSAFQFLTEEVIMQYTIGELLGQGGCSAVYAGERKADGTQVAIKFVIKDKYLNMMTIPGQKRVLPVEVALMEMVSKPVRSPYVLQLLDWFEIPSYFVLILEHPSPCMNLVEFYEHHGGKLSEALARDIMLQLVKAAQHCCDRGVFHNDVKSENVLINTETLQVKLIDFGSGDLLKKTHYKYSPGTPEYHPPEWYHHKKYKGCPTTIWTLGIVLFELVHGDLPFQTCEEVTNGILPFTPGLSADICKLISWCLKQNPKSRPTFKQILRHKWFTAGQSYIMRIPVIGGLARRLQQLLQIMIFIIM